MAKQRKSRDGVFKARVALEAIRERETVAQLSKRYGVYSTQIHQWKKRLVDSASEIFDSGGKTSSVNESREAELFEQIGRLQVELEWLKKNLPDSTDEKRHLVDSRHKEISVSRQCALLGLPRSSYYYAPGTESTENLRFMRMIDAEYMRHPFLGSRRITDYLQKSGYEVNRKRIQRLMQIMGLEAVFPRRKTTIRAPGHKVYPYLLRGLTIDRVNQVWSSDITYVPLKGGFMYLVAVMDWHSRHELSWRLSNTMDSEFCVEALNDALRHNCPKIFNTDQGAQFTSNAFTSALVNHRIAISMDGRDRALDNVFIERLWRRVKYEDIYLKDYESVADLQDGLKSYFDYYAYQRPHQGLENRTPWEVFASGLAS